TIEKESTQHRRDDGFPDLQIIRCPPMADAVVAVAIFQQHFPSMVTMECDGEGDPGVVCMFDARPFRFPLFVHFSSPLGLKSVSKRPVIAVPEKRSRGRSASQGKVGYGACHGERVY